MKKPNDNKLPLPKRYRDNPTTGEVLYEYIRASDKLRAAAILHHADKLLQFLALFERRNLEHVAKKEADRGLEKDEALWLKLKNSIAEKEANASEFRLRMKEMGVSFPIAFLKSYPCELSNGCTLACGRMIGALCAGRRYCEMNELTHAETELALQVDMKAYFKDDLKGLSERWLDPRATDSDLRIAFRDALRKRNATMQAKAGGRGRASQNEGLLPPKSALNDLWHYHIVQGVAEHTGRRIDDLLAPETTRAKKQAETLAGMIADTFKDADIDSAKKSGGSYSVKLTGTGDGGIDTRPIKDGARKAAKAIRAFEDECPLHDAAMEETARIQAAFARSFEEVCEIEKQSDIDVDSDWSAQLKARASNKALMPRLP